MNYETQITLFQSLLCLLKDIMENSFRMPDSVSVFVIMLEETEQRQKSLILEKVEKKILAVKIGRHCQLVWFEMLPTMVKPFQ